MTCKFAVFVFSFNRGAFLNNCVRSIQICAPHLPVYILDDNSTDPETRSVIKELSGRYRVVSNNNSTDVEVKTGGLSGLMNIAMEVARKDGIDFAIFIQDDMQFVRHINARGMENYVSYFESVTNSIQLATTFVRRLSADTFLDDYEVSSSSYAYIRRLDKERGKSSFSDTGVFSVRRFYEIFDSFEVGEDRNSEKARRLRITCGRAINPDMCWLPYPLSYRGKERTLKHRFFEFYGRSGLYPIDIMSTLEEFEFVSRRPEIVPVMERFLRARNSPRHDIWSTGGGEYNFLCYGSLPAKAFSVAKKLKHVLQS